MRSWPLLALVLPGCSSPSAPPGPPADAGAPPPAWLGDAGLVERAPVAVPLHAICGLAANPSDLPIGADPASAALRASYYAAMKELGVTLVRREFFWRDLEPAKGTFTFGAYDQLVAQGKQQGMRFLPILAYGTLWAHRGATDSYFAPDDPRDFAAYAGATARHYAGQVVGYEVWNEPNNGFRFWKPAFSGDPVAYGTLLALSAPALRAADPKAPVVLGGTVFTPQLIEGAMQWLGEAYAARPDLAGSFDVAAIHTYMAYPPRTAPEVGDDHDAPLEAKVQMHAWLLAQHGAGGDPMWITEIGWPVTTDTDAAAQARFMVRATILGAHAGAAAIYWYTLRDGPNHDPGHFPPEGSFGIMEYDADPAAGRPQRPKPSYVALRTLLATVGDRWPAPGAPALDGAPADARGVTFQGAAGGDVLAAWTVTSPAGSFRAPRAGQVVEQSGAVRGEVLAGAPVAISPDVTYLR